MDQINIQDARARMRGGDARPGKFTDPEFTASGEQRAQVALDRLETLWINTGTLCNIACVNCYIESSPTNDRLEYITAAETAAYLDEIATLNLPTHEIGFTGGEPFMNPDMLAMAGDVLGRGLECLILTNAMQPMLRPAIRQGLLALHAAHGRKLAIRVSLDHYSKDLHETERGPKSWDKALAGLKWLAENGLNLSIAGRTLWGESESASRAGYARLLAGLGIALDAQDPLHLVLLPEMDETADVPEITVDCWGILGVQPASIMCATSRMVVKRKGADAPTVLPCTLLPFNEEFEMGATLRDAARADGAMFDNGAVRLNHPHCSKFCVLGGGSCAAHG